MSTPAPPRLPPGERIRRAGIAAWSLIGLAIVAAGLIWILLKIKVVFPPLLIALILIYLLNPFIERLSARGMRRGLATAIVYVVLLLIVAGAVFALVPLVGHQVAQMSDRWPEIRDDIITTSHHATDSINSVFGTHLNADRVDCLLNSQRSNAPSNARCSDLSASLGSEVRANLDRITSIGLSVLTILVAVVIGLLVSLYLLIDLPQLQRDLINLVPERNREEVRELGTKAGTALGGFFRGQLLVAAIVGILSAFGFWLIGLPAWFFIGAIAGFFNLVPLVGPFIGGGIGFLVGATTGGIWLGVGAAAVELIVQQIDNHIISPNVIGRTVQLHPVTIMLSLLAGGTIGGFFGVFLAVPVVAVLKIVLYHVWVTRVLGYEVSPYGAGPGRAAPSIVPERDFAKEQPAVGDDDEVADDPEEMRRKARGRPEGSGFPDRNGDQHDAVPASRESKRE